MGSLSLQGIHKSFGKTEVLKGIDLEVANGEFLVFVGPSGCGKSTLLRIIAGLESPSAGHVVINEAQVTSVPPADRGIAMVFQTYALYPHLSVRDNMSLALKQSNQSNTLINERVNKASGLLSLDELLKRRPAELSGGQRQRVAIGRAIVREPELFLFDEPLSNLDAALRVQTRLEIARLHNELNATMIYVTHDQVEAMTLADRIVVLEAGVVQQVGTPMELYNNPVNRFVAGFIGSPKMNFIPGVALGLPNIATIGIRPEHISLSITGGELEGVVSHVEHLGADTNIYVDCDGLEPIVVRLFGEHQVQTGSQQRLRFKENSALQFDASGARL